MCGNLLEQELIIDYSRELKRFETPETDFSDEDSLECLVPGLTRWPVSGALELTQKLLRGQSRLASKRIRCSTPSTS